MGHEERSIWSHARQVGFIDHLWLGSSTERMYKQRIQISHGTFRFFLNKKLDLFLGKKIHV
jgi:hypothetical protein